MNKQSFRLHTAQQDVFIDQLLHIESAEYNIGGYIVLKGTLQVNLLTEAINNGPSLFDAFKMRFDERATDFTSFIAHDYQIFECSELDFSPQSHPATDAIKWMQNRLNQVYRLHQENCLFEHVLIKISHEEHWLFGRFHHLVTDGYGFTIWMQYLADKYKTLLKASSFNATYPSYLEEIEVSNTATTEALLTANDQYWNEKIRVKCKPLLHKKYSISGCMVPAASYSFVLNQADRIQLEALSKKINGGISQITIAALIVYFGKTSQQDRFVFGLPLHKRSSGKRRKIVGLFNSFIPFEGLFQRDQTVAELLRTIVTDQSADYRHHNFRLSSLTSHLQLNALEERLWDVIVNILPSDIELDFGDQLQATVVRMVNEYERIPLQLCWNNYSSNHSPGLQIHYLKAYFSEEEIVLFFNRILFILSQFSDNPDKTVYDVQVLPTSELELLEVFGRKLLPENYFIDPIPFENYLVQVLNQSGQLVPVGAQGELCISELQPNDLEISHPPKLIRKGILARWSTDGELVVTDKPTESSVTEFTTAATQVNICASFVAEPLEEYINYWSTEFDLNLQLNFAPYNQVFQQLLDPGSLFNSVQGINVLLLRLEDWVRDQQQQPAEKQIALIQRLYLQFEKAIDSAGKVSAGNCLYGIVPWIMNNELDAEVVKALKEIEAKIKYSLSVHPLFFELKMEEIISLYQVDTIFDNQSDTIGHVPFTDEMFAATGTYLCRNIRALKAVPYKVIALDCDNTLWEGVCGELGAMNVVISKDHAYLQHFVEEKYKQGFLIVLLSKNNEEDVWEVFDNHPGMVLKREHIISHKINWQPKSENLATIASELNLATDSFIFLDDNDFEIEQMEAILPGVLSLSLPAEQEAIPAFIDHIWAFDVLKVTEADSQRNQLYKAEKYRKEEQVKHDTIDDFITSLEVQVVIRKLNLQELDRAAQLSIRTNQFNLNGVTKSPEYISALIRQNQGVNRIIEVKDKFGEYGVVGLVLAEQTSSSLVLNSFLLSCRVLGRGVEDKVLHEMIQYCNENGLYSIDAMFTPTGKNKPFFSFLKRTNWMQNLATGTYSFIINPHKIPC